MKKTKVKNSNHVMGSVYELDGRVPLKQAVPFGLQHVLAMFVANITPIIIVAGAAKLSASQTAALIQCAMIIAGIGTMIQLYPVWKVGSGLPIVMGISFTFVSILCFIAAQYGYETAVGAVIVGGIIEGILGIFAKYWRKIISPIVAASVVVAIGFSLLSVGTNSFGGGFGNPEFGSASNLILGGITLTSCLLFTIFAKSYRKQLAVLFGLVVGYIVAMFMGMVDFSALENSKIIALPELMPFVPKFNINAIVSVVLIFLVSATETIGDTSALAMSGLGREVSDKEISGSIACDGFVSSLSGLFGCLPITSFSQNVGLVAMTKVINRFSILMGAVIMVLAGLFPIFGAILTTLPEAVLGGCTLIMFGSIVISGLEMMAKCGFNQRNLLISALSLSVGIGFTQVPEIFRIFPTMIQNVFAENCVAVVFLMAVILNLVLPKSLEQDNKEL
ncbi:nucleobase:cation symporter-2, NCS2 family [Hathewaya proteolytica DSM 3090]|uniref:Nucleobase:cation symporter-2, NCS2 family n=1 Tax=Hathewaya proteolytica DSM 3090 TaxID=1121331 RepID=A0A1M6QJA9_9CLOT|nr:nucleobase:cation symporter-2 family protein [Hathewaya proteolytica]SHK20322.1 nucleobase:cation symporter-2, NCS2 family [Hathewaya proteolytica DSM 3090]